MYKLTKDEKYEFVNDKIYELKKYNKKLMKNNFTI